MSNLTKVEFAKLSELVSDYMRQKSPDELELEIKLNTTGALFSQLYNAILERDYTGKIEQSVTISAPTPAGKIVNDTIRKEISFIGGVRSGGDKFIHKTTLHRFKKNEYSVKLAREHEIKSANFATSEFRFRLRSAIVLDDLENWRIDFTYTRKISKATNPDLIRNIETFRDKFFSKGTTVQLMDIEHFLDYEPEGAIHEIEIEFIGERPTEVASFVTEIEQTAIDILGMAEPQLYDKAGYHELLFEIASMLMPRRDALDYKARKTLKNLVNRPYSFDINEWTRDILPDIDNYYVSDKADGDRCFVVLGDTGAMLVTATHVLHMESIIVPDDYKSGLTVCDAEVLNLKDNKHGDIYLFDVLVYKGKVLADTGLVKREQKLETIREALSASKVIHVKPLVRLTRENYSTQIKDMFTKRKDRTYPVDGLIFTQAHEPYMKMRTYKWKPAEELTIDFLVKRAPKNHLVGVKQYKHPTRDGAVVYWLFAGIRRKDMDKYGVHKVNGWDDLFPSLKTDSFIPIQFSVPSNQYAYVYFHDPDNTNIDQLDGHVVEFTGEQGPQGIEWKIKMMRPDKDIEVKNKTSYGNNYKVAFDTYNLIKNPITLKDLITVTGVDDSPDSGYFQAQKSEMYKPGVKFNSFVVAQLLRMLENKNWVVDLAAGRGNHMFTLNGFSIKNAILTDVDPQAIAEAEKRRESFFKSELYIYGRKPITNMNVFTKVTDLKKPYARTVELMYDAGLPKNGADGVIMTFAMHYILENPASLVNLVNLVDTILKPGGVFIFTCFNGSRVSELLADVDVGHSWDKLENGQPKYSIKKLDDANTKISVIHPFSAGEYYEENLVRIQDVIAAFEARNYEVQQNGSFGDWLDKFKQFNNRLYSAMSADDKTYCGLYQYVTLWKHV